MPVVITQFKDNAGSSVNNKNNSATGLISFLTTFRLAVTYCR